MADNRRDKDKRLFFTRGQLVLLAGAFTLASVIIFFLGMIVGKGIEARKIIKTEEPLVKIPVKPSTQGSAEAPGAPAKEELTFYDTLTKAPGTEAPAEEKPKDPKSAEKTAKADVKPSKPTAKEEPAPATAKAAVKAAAAEAPAQTRTETPESKERNGSWTVQVNAYPDERSAKLLVDQLKNKGYNAKVTEVLNKGKTWYRVRVGRYESKEEAKKVEETLKSNENFVKAFATSR